MLTPDPDVPGAILEDGGDFVPDAMPGVFLVVGAPEWVVEDARVFDLGIRSRRISVDGRTVDVQLASDEALLQDYVRLEDQRWALIDATGAPLSLRSVVNTALWQVFGPEPPAGPPLVQLEPGTADADVRPYWASTNLITNPDFDTSIDGYLTGGTNTIAWNSGAGVDSNGFLRSTMAGATGAVYLSSSATTGYSVSEGDEIVVSYSTRTSVAAELRTWLRWLDADDQLIRAEAFGPYPLGTAFERFMEFGEAPVGAAKVVPYAALYSSASGRTWDIDRVMLNINDGTVDYFDGSTTIPGYTTEWVGTANLSPSTRTPLNPRDPELLRWPVGMSAWEFLEPLVQQSGLRLYCDEARQWFLTDPDVGSGPLVVIDDGDVIVGDDVIDRDGEGQWATGVAIRYTWDTPDGVQEKWDTAGTPEKVFRIDKDAPFPGAGAAASTLEALSRRGRVQTVRAATDYATTPLQPLEITLPGAPVTEGHVGAVTFDIATGLMDVRSLGLADE